MKNKKNLIIFGIVFVIIGIVCLASISLISNNINRKEQPNLKHINIYYYDKINNCLTPEEKTIVIDEKNFVLQLFDQMKMIPKSTNLQSIVPQNLKILNYTLEKEVLSVNLSDEYNLLSDMQKIIFRAGFVWTMTEMDSIKNINFKVKNKELLSCSNKPMGYLNRTNIILNPTLSPDKIEQEKIILYFANEQNFLVEEDRNIEAKQNKSLELQIVEELIKGPTLENHIQTIPQETKIRNIKTEDAICYVDLSNDFISKISNDETLNKLCIYSIVNSLTELDAINKVQFLIEGEKINLYGNLDISKPLGRDESLIQNTN